MTIAETTDIATGARRTPSRPELVPSYRSTSAIHRWFRKQGLQPRLDGAGGLEVLTDDRRVNEGNPRIVSVPATRPGNSGASDPGVDEKAGLISYTVITDDSGTDVTVGALGIYVEATGSERVIKFIGSENGRPVVFHEDRVAAVGPDDSNAVTIAADSFGCKTCTIVYDTICTGTYGVVGVKGCIYICTGTGPAWLPCSAGCAVLVGAITKYGCGYTADFFCENMVDFC